MGKVTGFTAAFNGIVYHKSLDLKVTVYYSTRSNLNVYNNSGNTSCTLFNGDNFTLKLTNLKEKTTYWYFTEVIFNGKVSFTDIKSFETGEADSYVGWEEGDNIQGEI